MNRIERFKFKFKSFIKSKTGIASLSIVALAAVVSVTGMIYSSRNGWKKQDGNLIYKVSGAEETGRTEIDKTDYIFDEKGNLYLGWFTFEGNTYYQDPKGLYKGDREINGIKYHFEEDGVFHTGVFEVDGVLCFRDGFGYFKEGQCAYAGYLYFVNADGTLFTGWKNAGTGPYYDPETGRMATGVTAIGDETYCFDSDGKIMTGFYEQWDGIRYFDESGLMLTGRQTLEGKDYYFNEEGLVTYGLVELEDGTYYFEEGGHATGWVFDDGLVRYFDGSGHMVTGEVTIDGTTYLFNDEGYTKIGWEGDVYYYHGYLASGIIPINSKVYYFNEDGTLFEGGWVTVDGRKYHFESDGAATTGWAELDGLKYYFYYDGKMAIGLSDTGSGVYCFDSEGQPMAAGWQTVDGVKCYVYDNGTVATGETTIDGVLCYFTEGGHLVVGPDEYAAMATTASAYDTSTNTLILVNRALHIVVIYQKNEATVEASEGSEATSEETIVVTEPATSKYTQIKAFRCTVGAGDSETITGEYHINGRMYYFDHGDVRLFYATRIYGGYFFHSVLYKKDWTPTTIVDGRIGQNLSLGCIRLEIDNAKYIYDNIPDGSTVVIY